MKRYFKIVACILLVLFVFQTGASAASSTKTPKPGDTQTMVYYLTYDQIYDSVGNLRKAKNQAQALETINKITVLFVTLPSVKFDKIAVSLLYDKMGNYLVGKIAEDSLNAITGVKDYKDLLNKYMDLLWELKPTSKSVVNKRVKVTATYTYKRTKMWGDVFEAWYNTGVKYEVVNN